MMVILGTGGCGSRQDPTRVESVAPSEATPAASSTDAADGADTQDAANAQPHNSSHNPSHDAMQNGGKDRNVAAEGTSATSTVPGLGAGTLRPAVAKELSHVDPHLDAWDTEAFNDAASSQLKQLAKIVHHPDDTQAWRGQVDAFAADEFTATALRPASLETVFGDQRITVRRKLRAIEADDPSTARSPRSHNEGRHTRISEMVDGLRAALQQDLDLEFRFKVVRVDRTESAVNTNVYVELSASRAGSDRFVQQTSTWQCVWTDERDKPRLKSVTVERFEEVESRGQLFTDDTATLVGSNESYATQLLPGADHWRQTLDWRFGQEIAGPHGVAVADVNGDGLDDVYYCETGGLPNRLFVQLPDGSAEDRSAPSGLDFLEPTHSALFVDLDNDADQDAVLAVGRFVLWFANDGTGRFTQQGILTTGSMLRSMAAADYDNDGDLDVYACGYFPRESLSDGVGLGRPMPYHDANNGVPNFLLANDGSGNLQDVTAQVGLDENNRRFSYAAAWEDYDNDGDMDLYVANDFGRNNLYRNDGGRFVDVASEAGVEDVSAGMSVGWGDFDRDGLFDLYVGNMFSSAGNRITYQRRFRNEEAPDTRAQYQRHARGNTLFRNRGDGTFEDVSEAANVTMGRWAWGCNFVDINNDGWEDLLVGNGMVTSVDDPDDL